MPYYVFAVQPLGLLQKLAEFDARIVAAIEEAHSLGVPVAIDSYGQYTDWAIEAGVDTLEHPLAMSDQAVALMKKHGTAFVPTIGAFDNLLTGGYPTAGIPTGLAGTSALAMVRLGWLLAMPMLPTLPSR